MDRQKKIPTGCLVLLGVFLLLAGSGTVYYGLRTLVGPVAVTEVEAGQVYCGGRLRPAQFREVIAAHKIRTVLYTDVPRLSMRETEEVQTACNRYNVRPESLILPADGCAGYELLDQAFELMNNPDRRPILVTGATDALGAAAVVAVYRVRVKSWTPDRALAELQAGGPSAARLGFTARAELPVVAHLRAYFKDRTGYEH